MGTGMLKTVPASAPPEANSALKGLRLQMVTMAVRMMKGDQALITMPVVSLAGAVVWILPRPARCRSGRCAWAART
jgi:hypothetical protein